MVQLIPMQSIFGCSSQSDPNRENRFSNVFSSSYCFIINSVFFCLNADILKYVLFLKKNCYEPVRVFEFYLKYEYQVYAQYFMYLGTCKLNNTAIGFQYFS